MSAVELATAYVSLVPSLKGANRAIADQLGPGAAAGGAEAGEKIGSGMLSRIGRIVTGVAIGNLVSNAVSSLSGMFTGFLKDAASASDATDKFKATLNFAGLDTSAIDKATAATQKYADQTVYDLPTIQNTTAQLAANGVKNYEGLTEAAGNLNAVAGGNADTFKSVALAITQTTGAGKLQTQNWMQLAEAVPGAAGKLQQAMKDAGAYTGNFNDAMANGQITADEFNQAIMKLGMQDGAVQAAKSTSTFEGAIGNLQATIEGGLTRSLNAAKPVITGAINLLTSGLGVAFSKVGSVVKNFSDGFKNGVDAIGSNQSALAHWGAAAYGLVQTVTGGIKAFGAAWKDNNGDVTSSGFAGFMERVANATHTAIDLLHNFKAGLMGVVDPSAFAGVANGPFKTFALLGSSIRQLFSGLGPAIAPLIPQIFTLVTTLSPLHLIFSALGPVLPQLVSMFGQLANVALAGLAQILPVITGAIGGVVSVVSNVVSWLLQFHGLVQAVAAGIAVAVVGFKLYEGAVVAIQAVTKAWAVVQGILNVVMDANPISLIIIGVAALIAAIVLLVANWDTVVSFISTVWGGFVNWIGDTLNSIGAWFTSVWNGIVSFIGGIINAIVSPIVAGFNWVATAIRVAVNFYAAIITSTFNAIAGFIGGIINAIVQPIVAAWTWTYNLVHAILIAFWQTHGAQLTAVWNTVVSIFTGIWIFISGTWNSIVGAVTGAVTAVWNVIVTVWTAAHNWLMGILTAIWGFISGVWNGIVGTIAGAVGAVWNVIVSVWTAAHNWLMGILSAIWGYVSTVWNGIVGAISGAAGSVWGVISSVFGQVAGFLGGVWGGIVNGVSGMIGNVVGYFGGLGSQIMGVLSGAGSWLFSIGQNIVQGLIDGVKSLAGTIGNAFLSMIPGWIVGPFKAALGINSPSRVFRGFGQNIGQGIMLGTEDVRPDVEANIRNLVKVPAVAAAGAGVAGSASRVQPASANGGTQLIVQGNVYGNPEDIVDEMDSRARRSNAVNGIRAIAVGAA